MEIPVRKKMKESELAVSAGTQYAPRVYKNAFRLGCDLGTRGKHFCLLFQKNGDGV